MLSDVAVVLDAGSATYTSYETDAETAAAVEIGDLVPVVLVDLATAVAMEDEDEDEVEDNG